MQLGINAEITPAVIRRHMAANVARTKRRGGYYPPANVANFWAEPIHTNQCPDVANMPCSDMISPNFICKCLMVHCRRIAPTLFPRRGNNRADDIRPYADVPHRKWCVF